MKFTKSDFPLMRWSLGAISASILLSGVILYGSGIYAEKNNNSLLDAQRQLTWITWLSIPPNMACSKSRISSATTTGWTG
jgi:hypothetical protein